MSEFNSHTTGSMLEVLNGRVSTWSLLRSQCEFNSNTPAQHSGLFSRAVCASSRKTCAKLGCWCHLQFADSKSDL